MRIFHPGDIVKHFKREFLSKSIGLRNGEMESNK